jgi:membrane-bound lytic murein transglycosylase MltF
VATLDDLAGKEIVVRRSSSYYESLVALNEKFRREGKPAVELTPADENLEDEDLIEMVNAGLYPIIVVDEHKARFWKQVFPDIVVHEDIAVRSGGEIAWAFRKDSPKLKAEINAFVKDHKIGTTFGNILMRRYFKDAKYVKKSMSVAELKKFRDTVAIFQQYAGQYQFDWLMIAAQAYQESGIDQSVRSAIGVMQVMPKTAAGAPILIQDIYDIENNIHAGIKYLRFMIDEYFNDPQIAAVDRLLFAFASYNGGPNRIVRLRGKAAAQGLDPNRWFQNVEIVVARHIGRETTQYVGNIFKYYVAYKRLVEELEARKAARERAIENAGDR